MQLNELTRKHFGRLRIYWQLRDLGGRGNRDRIDIELVTLGLLELVKDGSSLRLTRAGVVMLEEEGICERARRQPHHDFGERLALWLHQYDRTVWTNIEFNIGSAEQSDNAIIRPDVFSVKSTTTAANLNPIVHEVKISRSDFLADVANPGKRHGYSQIASRVYYAAPMGIIAPEETPEGCGLVLEISPGVFEQVLRAKKRPFEITPKMFMNMVLKQKFSSKAVPTDQREVFG